MDFIFDAYTLQSAEPQNTINLELPLGPLQRALKSALNAASASLHLTKKNGLPVLSMTIKTTTSTAGGSAAGVGGDGASSRPPRFGNGARPNTDGDDDDYPVEPLETDLHREHEKIITQDIPVRVLHPETVETIMQPKVREPDVHIQLPPLMQLKAISDRFTKLALTTSGGGGSGGARGGAGAAGASRGGGVGRWVEYELGKGGRVRECLF